MGGEAWCWLLNPHHQCLLAGKSCGRSGLCFQIGIHDQLLGHFAENSENMKDHPRT